MCRMALVIGQDKPLSLFETAFKSSWARSNDDGVGIYWRDYNGVEGQNRHLARFARSDDLGKIKTPYDRMLIHFRKATKGDGTHPFTCKHFPQNNSGNWLLVHNGVVSDEGARQLLGTKHEFSTGIDSEVFIHIWGELNEPDLLKRAKEFAKAVEGHNVTGWANLIFYNVITDEWVAFSDGSLDFVYNKDTLIICSDTQWLDMSKADKHIKKQSLASDAVAYGVGLDWHARKDIWSVHSCKTNNGGLYSGSAASVASETAARAAARAYMMESNGGDAEDYSAQYGNPKDHAFVSSDTTNQYGVMLCATCYWAEGYHIKDFKEQPKTMWDNKHPFTRNNKLQGIVCMCGSQSTYGSIHVSHEFVPINHKNNPTDFCQTCGSRRVTGNHIENNPNNHYFAALTFLKQENNITMEVDSPLCMRCAGIRRLHNFKESITFERVSDTLPVPPIANPKPMTNEPAFSDAIAKAKEIAKKWTVSSKNGFVTVKLQPAKDSCACILTGASKQICQTHVGMGFKFIEGGFLVKQAKETDDKTLSVPDEYPVYYD